MTTETVYICSGERTIIWSSCTVSANNREIIPYQQECHTCRPCYKCPGCIYGDDHDEYACDHTLDEEFAKNGKCRDPENHPERFKFYEQKIVRDGKSCDGYYWEI